APLVAGWQCRQPRNSTFDVCGKWGLARRRLGGSRRRSRRPDADRAAPAVEEIENVGLTELDPNGTAPRPLCVVPLAILIDPAERDLQRHAKGCPSAHLLERWSNDANQVPFVLAAEVRFNLAGVLAGIHGVHSSA